MSKNMTIIRSFISYQSTFNPETLDKQIADKTRNLKSNRLVVEDWAIFTPLSSKNMVVCDFLCEDTYRPLGETQQRGIPANQ